MAKSKLSYPIRRDSIMVSQKRFADKFEEIDRIQLSQSVCNTMRFALYRSNLYYLGVGKSVQEDLETYTQYVKTIEMTHLLISSVRSLDSFSICFKNIQVEELYQQVIKDNCFVVYNTFHFGAFISLVDYLAFHNEEVYVLVSSWMKSKPLEHNKDKVGVFNSKHNSKVNVKLISSEDISCLLQLKEIKEMCQVSHNRVAVVTLIDGNMLEPTKDRSKYSYYFLNNKVRLRQHVTTMAERLNAPLVHCYVTSQNQRLKLNIQDVFDFSNSGLTSTEVQKQICLDFEREITENSIGLWTMIADLHVTIERKERFSQPTYLVESDYDDKRFTEVYVGHDLFIFDSKYGILYEANNAKMLTTKKEKVLYSNVVA